MGLEAGTTIAELNASWPLGSDPKSQGDDHLRLIKKILKGDALSLSGGGDVNGFINLANDMPIHGRETGGTDRFLIKMNSLNETQFGSSASQGATYLSGIFHKFMISNVEAMRINSVGRLLVNRDTSFDDSRVALEDSTEQVLAVYRASASAGQFIMSCYSDINSAGGRVMTTAVSGNITNFNGVYGQISDVRLKENIVDAAPQLSDLLQMRVVNFNMIGDDTKQVGLVAQELQQIKPNLVEEDEEGTLSIKTSVLVPLMLKALQELAARVTALEAA